MKTTLVLLDGGQLTYDSSQLVPVGDYHGIPETVVYQHPGDTRRPACEVKIEIWDGVPTVAEVNLAARRDDGVRIRAKDIKLGRAVYLDGLMADWLAEVAYRLEPAPPGRRRWSKAYPGSAADREAARRTIERAQSRRRLTKGQLRQIAETYKAADPPKHEAIALAFGVHERTAQRYIERAREEGFLPPTTRGKAE